MMQVSEGKTPGRRRREEERIMTTTNTTMKLCETEGRGDRVPFAVLFLAGLLGISAAPLLMMLIRPFMTSGSGFWFLLKALVFLAMIGIGVLGAWFVGSELIACTIVDKHHGRYTKAQKITMQAAGVALAALCLYSILNLYGVRLLGPLDGLILAVRDTLGRLTGIRQSDDLRRSFLEMYLFIGLSGAGMVAGAAEAWETRCPCCGRYNAHRSVLVDSELLGVEHGFEEAESYTQEERLNGPLGGRGTGMNVDLFNCMDAQSKAKELAYFSDYNPLTREAHGVRETTTQINEVEIAHKKNTFRITCKYCGAFIRDDVKHVQEKKVLNTTEHTDTEDVTYRVY